MFAEELRLLEERHLLRRLVGVGRPEGHQVTVRGKEAALFCSNDYLGLAGHPALVRAAEDALRRWGAGTGASRLISGNYELHEELERRVAAFKGEDAAVLFNSGYAANTGVIPAVACEGDVIFSDRLNHASIIDGCRLSRARTEIYRHCDMEHLEALLKQNAGARRRFIITDGVFSMDGDIAPLQDIAGLADRYSAVAMVDDAHGTGVLGKRGTGTAEHFGLEGRIPVQMGTLGKALGSFGAYVAGDRDLVRYLMNTARSFIFSTSLPPAVCAATIAALQVVQDEPQRREQLWKNRSRLVRMLEAAGIGTGPSATPIIPLATGSSESALRASERALDLGLFCSAVRPPTVPEGGTRLRLTVTAAHRDADIDRAAGVLATLEQEGYFERNRT